MAATFEEAYVAARERYPVEWNALPPAAHTAAIYAEMRRIDAEHCAKDDGGTEDLAPPVK